MVRIVPLLAAILGLAIFAGGVVHVGQMTHMAVAMTSAASDQSGMPDCPMCPQDDEQAAMACATGCILANVAILPAMTWVASVRVALGVAREPMPLFGYQHPPDPHPPRFSVLT